MAVKPDHPRVQELLNNMSGLDLSKVMAARKEPLVVPHYQLLTLEELQKVRIVTLGPLLVITCNCVARAHSTGNT